MEQIRAASANAPGRAGRGPTIGWDLGGVHVKAACVVDGRVRATVQAPCPLWQGLQALDEALGQLPDWARAGARHAVTMTGELTDCFASRSEGVAALVGWARDRLAGTVAVYGGREGFLGVDRAAGAAGAVASANWHATASLVGTRLPAALVVDIGSTTADLVPVAQGLCAAVGSTDAERLEAGELVYSGVVRTPLPALATRAPFRGGWVRLVAEPFATTADVYRLIGRLAPEADQQDTADAQGKSLAETEIRLARIVARDRAEGDADRWRGLAAFFAERQLAELHEAAAQVLSRGVLPEAAPVVACGAGRFLAEDLARRLGRDAVDLASLIGSDAGAGLAPWIDICGPAVAVALLLDRVDRSASPGHA